MYSQASTTDAVALLHRGYYFSTCERGLKSTSDYQWRPEVLTLFGIPRALVVDLPAPPTQAAHLCAFSMGIYLSTTLMGVYEEKKLYLKS